jgi:bifunctional non-homologous end joining protein LigD
MYHLLKENEINKAVFHHIPTSILRKAHWVKPVIVVEVEYSSLTKDRILRHPSFKGIRYDKDPTEVILEG